MTRPGEARAFFLAAVSQQTDECILWPFNKGRGYGRLRDGKRLRQVSHLACEYAHGPCPPGMEAAHGECHRRDCFNPKHLYWATRPQNSRDRIRDGTAKSHLTERDVFEIRQLRQSGEWTLAQLADEFGVSLSGVGHIVTRRRWKDVQ